MHKIIYILYRWIHHDSLAKCIHANMLLDYNNIVFSLFCSLKVPTISAFHNTLIIHYNIYITFYSSINNNKMHIILSLKNYNYILSVC